MESSFFYLLMTDSPELRSDMDWKEHFDGKTGQIQDEYMLPYFKEEDYSKGILEGYKALLVEVYKSTDQPEEKITPHHIQYACKPA